MFPAPISLKHIKQKDSNVHILMKSKFLFIEVFLKNATKFHFEFHYTVWVTADQHGAKLNLLGHILYRHQYDISSTLHETYKQTVPNIYEMRAKWYMC
jgi:hypothetical protein